MSVSSDGGPGVHPESQGREISAGSITGLRVAITRSADRAGALADALAAAGAEPVLVPLIDFEVADQQLLGAAMARLTAGKYRWLVISSITTVRALKQWCETAGTTLADLIPETTRVATIGPTSVAVLAAEGVAATLAPTDLQSAAGLLTLWPETADGGRALLPQSDLAEATLGDGIRARGWAVDGVTAYRTVDFPAVPDRRLTAVLAHSTRDLARRGGYTQLTPDQAAREISAGLIHAVVLASGSAARRVAATMAPLPPTCWVIAIGPPTRAAAQRLGMNVAATAVHPTPGGIVEALYAAHNNFHTK
ncbi:uroporphyrinogen-III synthase [Arthrobacter alpinus]|uniref:uroporphyrinogen-III synthase n=1 Tax=Arthrobacter alpinus TaxID=656366 RepID=UPI0028F709C9|nr:uroporphyrinogen-III synthase [Arthrobacter alpinus]